MWSMVRSGLTGVLCLLFVCGCGTSETSDGAASGAAGVPLAIPAPHAPADSSEQPQQAERSEADQATIDQLVAKARQAIAAGHSALAVEALSQAIGIDPGDARLLRMRADVYAASRELASARADFSTAILADPDNAELYNARGYFLLTSGLIDEAMADFDRAVELDPKLAAAWNNRGLVWLQRGDYAQAERQFQAAVDCQPDYADAWNNLGFAMMKQDRLQDALDAIRRALEVNPDYVTAWNNHGLISMRMQDYESAVQAFSKTIELAPLDGRWYVHRQVALRELGRFTEAARDQRRVEWTRSVADATQELQRRPNDAQRWVTRGELLLEGDLHEAAIRDFTQALNLQPDNVQALNGRARAYTAVGRLQEALDDCEQSIVIEATPAALSLRGDVWLAMMNLDSAIADFERAMRCDSTVAQAYRERAAQREERGQHEAAQQDREAAKRIEDALAGRLPDESGQALPFPD